MGHARITITLDIYTHLFDDARHAEELRKRMADSQFAELLNLGHQRAGATVLQLPSARDV